MDRALNTNINSLHIAVAAASGSGGAQDLQVAELMPPGTVVALLSVIGTVSGDVSCQLTDGSDEDFSLVEMPGNIYKLTTARV